MVSHAGEVNGNQRTSVILTRQAVPEGVQESAQCRNGLNAVGLEAIFVPNFYNVQIRNIRKSPLYQRRQPTEKKMFSLCACNASEFLLCDGSEVVLSGFDFTLEDAYRVIKDTAQPLPEFSKDVHIQPS